MLSFFYAKTFSEEPQLTKTAEVWMAVLHEKPLSSKPEGWCQLRSRIDGLKFWSGQVDTRTDEALGPFVPLLASHKIQVAFERMYWPPFSPNPSMEWYGGKAGPLDHTTGDRAAVPEVERLQKWKRLGGVVQFIDIDDPMRNLIHPGWPVSFGGGLDRKMAVQQCIQYMLAVRKAEPNIEFFIIVNFPLWAWKDQPSYVGNEFLGEYSQILEMLIHEAKLANCGLRGVTADSPYEMTVGSYRADWLMPAPYDPSHVDWLSRLLDLERTVRQAGLEFNLVVNSHELNASDYCNATLEYVRTYRRAGGRPDRWIVQSWFEYPQEREVLPESTESTFTNLVLKVIAEVNPDK
jgi:hypothetical protein